jgi:hypothetical protein
MCGVARVRGKIIPAQVLADLRGKGLCGKEAFLPTAFLVTFVATKVTALPRQLSGPMLLLLLNNVNSRRSNVSDFERSCL